jgi:Cft2 family RNA processing exonuclease
MKRDVPVRCRIERFRFSAHAKQDELLEVIRRLSPKSVVMTHGDISAMNAFGAVVNERHPQMLITAPEIGKWYTLSE